MKKFSDVAHNMNKRDDAHTSQIADPSSSTSNMASILSRNRLSSGRHLIVENHYVPIEEAEVHSMPHANESEGKHYSCY